ncbi:MAG TPA: bifunctional phosphopantothenoylcysteine decarboxylase/phosphopantothenate--cysteine ligase CoaBC [Solirubrobacterales bacterium]|jgi:phosphopantothenoylcysteine decarboxylase/phosphopantothenate--cysteine ligase|nr:bifunctional phosphopantothenoylcysteine decarboxylase/phosphopantothenate--cysteine ligase CoaBC [Solirubrobacterales bacterium]
MARVLLGVSGGIAAYKSLEFARLATVAGHGVRVVMTEAATRFVGAASFEGIIGAPVLTSEFEHDPMRGAFPGDPQPGHDPIGHLEVAANCDAYLVAPASANTIAKLATGMADSMLTTSFLACVAPRLIAPAMNDRMYADAATQANLATLRDRGIAVIEPDEGPLASRGELGKGRLPDPAHLLARVEAALPTGSRPWDGLRVLVTAGGTREPIDPVRYIGNRSSGRMGIALAAAAARRGADVTLIAANIALPEPSGVRRIDVETADQLAKTAQAEFPSTHVLLMAAAPADFRATEVARDKLKRQNNLDLHLEPTEDILAALATTRTASQTIVGFAAEHGEEGVDRARAKLSHKGADLIVLNDVSDPEIGFESQQNAVTLIDKESETFVPQAPKDSIADTILERVDQLRHQARLHTR